MPYTFVLTPPPEQAKKYVEVSQTLYSEYQPYYLLTKDGTSSPHVTVVQFECDTSDLAHEVWIALCALIKEEDVIPFTPPFTGVAFVEGVGDYENTTWVEMSIKRGDKNSSIMKVHEAALKILNQYKLNPLNACGNDYRPHLTLARIKKPDYMKLWPNNLCENPGSFKLEFGLSDGKWQYAETLASFP